MTQIIYSVKNFDTFMKKQKFSKLCFVVPTKLLPLIKSSQLDIEQHTLINIEDREKVKNLYAVENLLKEFIEAGLDRKSIVFAIGGGTVGDAVGFACSIYLRGIRYINVPTTLVSQVDSAHGGKTGVNFSGYKNMVGTFHPAVATFIEPSFIQSLHKEQIIDGLGEIIKAGFIKDPSILKLLEKETLETLPMSKNLEKIIKKAIAVKQYYIKKDPFDHGVRQILNVGHTIGHAIELKNNISHGKAVLIGMDKEFEVCKKLGFTHPSVRMYFHILLKKIGITLEKGLIADLSAIQKDKKVIGDKLILPIVVKVGKSSLTKIGYDVFIKEAI